MIQKRKRKKTDCRGSSRVTKKQLGYKRRVTYGKERDERG